MKNAQSELGNKWAAHSASPRWNVLVVAFASAMLVSFASWGCMDSEKDLPLAVGPGIPTGGQRVSGEGRGDASRDDASRDAAAPSNPQGGAEGGVSNGGSGPPDGGGFEGGMSPEGGSFDGGVAVDGGGAFPGPGLDGSP